MKNLLLLIGVLFFYPTIAQNRTIRPVEVELGGGVVFGAAKLERAGFDKNKIGQTGFLEARYNMNHAPLDFGFQVRGVIQGRQMSQSGEKLNFSSWNLMITSDYNFFRDSNYSLFAGAGVGLATFGNSSQLQYHSDKGYYTDNGSSSSLCFMPRIGVELWHHVRFTCSYVIEEKANRHVALSVGVVFGGGKK